MTEPTDKKADAGGGSVTVRGMVDQVLEASGNMHPRADLGQDGDARAASAAQGGVPNINVAKAIEAVKKDSIIDAPPPSAAPVAAPTGLGQPVTVRAAGILFVTKANQALFVKRGPGGDHAGEWCFPAGVIEDDESPEQAARRETNEEVGYAAEGDLQPWTRKITAEPAPDGFKTVDCSTFLQRLDEPFPVVTNEESVGYAWAPIDQPPEPLHPGCRIALAKLGMDELGLARAIAAGELTSPQHYQNMWLFDMRITGTGYSYRKKLNEFVYRRPEHYLTDDYLARCNGLPVIMMHPPKATLDSDEFSDRIIGAMMLPYIKENEVWGIARIYDDEAAAMMQDKARPLSTSPSVVLRKVDNTKMTLEDGATLLIEGKPKVIDHLAVCEYGVWDKGEGPKGIRADTITEELAMADDDKKTEKEEKKPDAAEVKKPDAAEDKKDEKKSDSDAGDKLDKLLSMMDSTTKRLDEFGARMDSFDGKKADAAEDKKEEEKDGKSEKKADKKADADDKDEKKADATEVAARADADRSLREQIAALEKRIPKSMNDAEYHAMADAQARADNVFMALGKGRAPRPLEAENLAGYRRRLVRGLKEHSRWKDSGVEAMADDTMFKVAEDQVYADAQVAAAHPVDLPAGQIRAITQPDTTGRQITTFYGEPKSWMDSFAGQPMRLTRINNGSARRDH